MTILDKYFLSLTSLTVILFDTGYTRFLFDLLPHFKSFLAVLEINEHYRVERLSCLDTCQNSAAFIAESEFIFASFKNISSVWVSQILIAIFRIFAEFFEAVHRPDVDLSSTLCTAAILLFHDNSDIRA